MVCTVTGTIHDLTGSTLPNQIVRFRRTFGVVSQDNVTVVPAADVETASDASGNISVDLYPGTYRASTKGYNGSLTFTVGVPDAASAVLKDIINQLPEITPSVLSQAVDAKNKAEEWATNPEDDPVETGPNQYSSLHWAAKSGDSASAAATSETNAASSASAAATSETNAATSEENASASESLAADWAEKGDGLDVDGVGTRSAKHHANQSSSSASAASTSASNAATSESNAATSATNAASSASAASTSEVNAEGFATEAKDARDEVITANIKEKTADYTLAMDDAFDVIEMNLSVANTVTIPAEASVDFPVGSQITVVQTGSGKTTIVGAAGVTVNTASTLDLDGQWQAVWLVKRGSDNWLAAGGLS